MTDLNPLQLETLRKLADPPRKFVSQRDEETGNVGWMNSEDKELNVRSAASLVRRGLAEGRRCHYRVRRQIRRGWWEDGPSRETYPEYRITEAGRTLLSTLGK